jgi:hypothetical protein
MVIMTKEQLEKILKGHNEILSRIKQLMEMHGPEQYKYDTYSILNTKQAADLLNVPQTVLLEACINGELPCREIAKTYIFQRDQLITWLSVDEPMVEVKDSIDTITAAELLGVPPQKIRQWAAGWCYYKMPIIRKGNRVFYDREQLLEWAETPVYKQLKETYLANLALHEQRLKAAEAQREAERLEKEAKKKARLEKKLSKV